MIGVRLILGCAIFPLLVTAPVTVLAWAEAGHKVVALIAFERLSPQQRTSVVAMLQHHPSWEEMFARPMALELPHGSAEERERWIFAKASIWPDLVRPPIGVSAEENPYKAFHHGSWHYTDLPVFPTEADRTELAKHDRDPFMDWHPGWHEALRGWNSVQVLKMAAYELPRLETEDGEKALMLSWLFHLIGDMHQPCHCVSLYVAGKLKGGDRGANSLTLAGMEGLPLHAFWDNQLNADPQGRAMPLAEAEATAKKLLLRTDLTKTAAASLEVTDPEAWLQEGRKLAIAHVYTPSLLAALKEARSLPYTHDGKKHNLWTLVLSEADQKAYQQQAKVTSERQVVVAGYRLAKALQRIESNP